jgi:hypothetical protein
MTAFNSLAVSNSLVYSNRSVAPKAFTPGVLTNNLGTLGTKQVRASGTLFQPSAGSITYYFTSTKAQTVGVSLKNRSSTSFNFQRVNLFNNAGTKIAKTAGTLSGNTLTFRSKIAAGNYNVTFSLKGTKAAKYTLTLSPGLV